MQTPEKEHTAAATVIYKLHKESSSLYFEFVLTSLVFIVRVFFYRFVNFWTFKRFHEKTFKMPNVELGENIYQKIVLNRSFIGLFFLYIFSLDKLQSLIKQTFLKTNQNNWQPFA